MPWQFLLGAVTGAAGAVGGHILGGKEQKKRAAQHAKALAASAPKAPP